MKKLSTILFLALSTILINACKKDNGYYNAEIKNETFKGSTYDYLKSRVGVYDSLVKVIDRIGAQQILKDSTVTLFALTNSNFQLAIENLNNTLLYSDKPAQYLNSVKYNILDSLMCQYIIRGKILTDSLQTQDGTTYSSVRYSYPMHAGLNSLSSSGYLNGGPKVISFSDTKRRIFNRFWVTTETSSVNLKTDNGIVHTLNPDHVFGFDKFVSQMIYIPPPPNLFKTIGGIHSVSKEYSGGPNGREASKFAFDGIPETKFFLGNPGQFWMQFEFPEPTLANSYTLMSANDSQSRDPKDWTLVASNDGTTWTTLDRKSSEVFKDRYQLKVYFFRNTVAYKFYRLNIAQMYNGYDFQLADWTMNFGQ